MNYFYVRVSYKTLPMDNQILTIGRFINRNNIENYEIIKDVSCGFYNRKGNTLFDLITNMHTHDTLYVCDISRISRSMERLQLFNQYILDKNIKFICVNQTIEEKFINNSQNALNTILSNITELEIEYISIIAKKALNKLKEQGVKLGAPPKYDETMVAKVKELKRKGLSCREIGTELGMSKATASRLARYEPDKKETVYIDVPLNIKLEMWADLKMGKSIIDLSKKYKLDVDTISNIIASLKGGGHW